MSKESCIGKLATKGWLCAFFIKNKKVSAKIKIRSIDQRKEFIPKDRTQCALPFGIN